MRFNKTKLKDVAEILGILMHEPLSEDNKKAHVQIKGEWLAAEPDDLDKFLAESEATNVAYTTGYGAVSITTFREPLCIFISSHIDALGAWSIQQYDGAVAEDIMNNIGDIPGQAHNVKERFPDDPTLTLPALGEFVKNEVPLYDGEPID